MNTQGFYSDLNTPTITAIILPKLQTNNKAAPCNLPGHQQQTQCSFQGTTYLSPSGPSQCHAQLSFGRTNPFRIRKTSKYFLEVSESVLNPLKI